MPEDHLREVLRELHGELERSDSIDEKTRSLLRGARGDIEDALQAPAPDATARAAAARGLLTESMERFQGEHPEAAAALARVLDALSAVGI